MKTSNDSDDTIITINGVNLKFGNTLYPEYNLSNLKPGPYKVKADGYYNKRKPILDPLDWIKSREGQRHMSKIRSDTGTVLYIETKAPLTICTHC